MGKIVPGKFVQKQDLVYPCKECGNQTFWIQQGGTVCCKTCSMKQLPSPDWCKALFELLKDVED